MKLLPRLTFGNPNIALALCYPIMVALALLSLVTELVANKFLLMEAKVWGEGVGKVWRTGVSQAGKVCGAAVGSHEAGGLPVPAYGGRGVRRKLGKVWEEV